MSFLQRMAARAVGASGSVRPRIRARFEPAASNPGAQPMEVEQFIEVSALAGEPGRPRVNGRKATPASPPAPRPAPIPRGVRPAVRPESEAAATEGRVAADEPAQDRHPQRVDGEPGHRANPAASASGRVVGMASKRPAAEVELRASVPALDMAAEAPDLIWPEVTKPLEDGPTPPAAGPLAGTAGASSRSPESERTQAPGDDVNPATSPPRITSESSPAPESETSASGPAPDPGESELLAATGPERLAAAAEPVVHVHIGRIDVRASAPPPRSRSTQPPIESLDDYLRRTSGRR